MTRWVFGRMISLLVVGAILFGTTSAFAQSNRDLNNRMESIQRQLRAVQDRLIDHLGKPGEVQGASQVDREILADMEVRLGAIDRELRQLTGNLEEINFRQRKIESDFERFRADVDMRFGDLTEGGLSAGSFTQSGGVDAADRVSRSAALGLTPTKTPEDAARVVEEFERQTTVIERPNAPEVTALSSARSILPEGNVQTRYDAAFGYMRRGDFAGAEAAFMEFLQSHGNDPLAGNAQYWLGESFYARKDYANAAAAFLNGYQNYSDGPKAPDNLLKLGMSLGALGQAGEACTVFGDIEARYPDANANIHAAAQREFARLGCS